MTIELIETEDETTTCEGCYFNKGRNGCIARVKEFDACLSENNISSNYIYVEVK